MPTTIHPNPPAIRFRHRDLAELRSTLMGTEQRESFAILLAKRHLVGQTELFTVCDIRFPGQQDYEARSRSFLRMRKQFIGACLAETVQRLDVDSLIEVHTHPFSEDMVAFSSVDDNDERRYAQWLHQRFENLHYASIVLSQNRYQARVWRCDEKMALPSVAALKTQTVAERIPASNEDLCMETLQEEQLFGHVDAIFNRGALALGLDVMRKIMVGQTVALVGVGGIGSVIAEHLVQMGFQRLVLIDPDKLEVSNLNRFVGATHAHAEQGWYKVEAVAQHLRSIRPTVQVQTCIEGVESDAAREILANSDWILLSTDSHSSRWETQRLALLYFVPLISAGVNISVEDGRIEDMSGEVITARSGDRWCLNCLERIDIAKMAAESHPDEIVRQQTVQRGYVTGMAMKEPAVKTLNTMVATMAVDRLVDQFLPDRAVIPIQVYEHNRFSAIYEDRISMKLRNLSCSYCSF